MNETSVADPDCDARDALLSVVNAVNLAWQRGESSALIRHFHPDMIATLAAEGRRLQGGAACFANWRTVARTCDVRHWRTSEPVIRVFGHAAVVSYDFQLSLVRQGVLQHLRGSDTLFLVFDQARWQIVADHYSEYPSPPWSNGLNAGVT
ncbi:YybH family protein [Chitinibacteraceae bacterium HSL-7]